jgi:hypothetical protein
MDSIFKQTTLWFTLILGLSMITYGFVAGPISFLSLLDVVTGKKPFADLHKQRPFSPIVSLVNPPDSYDGNAHLNKNKKNYNYNYYLDELLTLYLHDLTQAEVDFIQKNLPPLRQARQDYWDNNISVLNTVETLNVTKTKMGTYTGGYSYDIGTRTVTYFLQGKYKDEARAFLKENHSTTKLSPTKIQVGIFIYEFSTSGGLLYIYPWGTLGVIYR